MLIFFLCQGKLITSEHKFLDQRLALGWVRRNIAAFEKYYPEKVTIFGQNAGELSEDALITSPPNPLTFRAATLQSTQSSVTLSAANSTQSWELLLTLEVCCSGPGGVLECT